GSRPTDAARAERGDAAASPRHRGRLPPRPRVLRNDHHRSGGQGRGLPWRAAPSFPHERGAGRQGLARRLEEFGAAFASLPDGADKPGAALDIIWQKLSGRAFYAWLEL